MGTKNKDTRTDLVEELTHLQEGTVTAQAYKQISRLIKEAEGGSYHDYKSKYAAPKLKLALDLEEAGLASLAERVKRGEFDEVPDKEDIERMQAMVDKWLS